MKTNLILAGGLLMANLFAGCEKDKDPEPTPTPSTTQELALVFRPVAGSDDVDFATVHTSNSGQKYTVSTLRYYMSNIRLIKSDNSEYPLTGKYLLVQPSVSHVHLGQVPLGSYKGIKFAIGIDSATNHMDPALYPAGNPLAQQNPSMHWNWNAGYIFLQIEGSCDTTSGNTGVLTSGVYDRSMFFHLGMDALYRNVDLSNSAFTVDSSGEKHLYLKADVNELLEGVDLTTENQSHTMGTMMLATKIANNIANMFTLSE
jgi:archaellin